MISIRKSLGYWGAAVLLATAALGMTQLAARDVFVNNVAGNDSLPGNAPVPGVGGFGPCRTIGRALRLMLPGDTLVIANTGQPYRECITLEGGLQSGSPNRPTVIQGNGAVLDGSRPVPAQAWEHVADDVFRYQPPHLTFTRLYLGGSPAQEIKLSGAETQLPALEPLQWCRLGGYLYFRTLDGLLPGQYDLSYAHHQVGVTLYEARYVILEDLVVQGFRLDGVNAHDNATAIFYGLDCRHNGRSGISVGGSSDVQILDCWAAGNGAAQIRTEGYCLVDIAQCDLAGDTAPPLVVAGGDVTLDDRPVPVDPSAAGR